MNLLLDTHSFLWWIQGGTVLSERARQALEEARGTVYLSAASLWEMAIKIRLGKLRAPEPFDQFILRQVQDNRLEILPIHAQHVLATMNLPAHHRDPFDRLLIAQAQTEDLLLISRDAVFGHYDVKVLW